MLERIKNWALAGLGVLVGLLFGILTLYKERLGAAKQEVALDKAKEELADAVSKQAVAEKTAGDAVSDFNALADAYERSKGTGK